MLLTEINRAYIDTTVVKTINMGKETGATGWHHAVVSLHAFKSAPYIQLAFLAQIGKTGDKLLIDNIKIENNPELSVSGIMTRNEKNKLVYDLSGKLQQDNNLPQGLYITGGKKFVIR